MQLLKEISEIFSTQDNAADLAILYEVTSYQAANDEDQFWEGYKDFGELGDTNLVSTSRNEELLAKKRVNVEFTDVDIEA